MCSCTEDAGIHRLHTRITENNGEDTPLADTFGGRYELQTSGYGGTVSIHLDPYHSTVRCGLVKVVVLQHSGREPIAGTLLIVTG
jgi:hypothetical protein